MTMAVVGGENGGCRGRGRVSLELHDRSRDCGALVKPYRATAGQGVVMWKKV